MVSSINLQTLQGPPLKSHFLGQNHTQKPFFATPKQPSKLYPKPCAKFDIFEIMGGRGLCNGEKGIEQELKRNITEQASQPADREEEDSATTAISTIVSVPENAFEKELLGLTGGFPGGETGLKQFIEKNPPPKKSVVADSGNIVAITTSKKPKPPEFPL